MDRSHLDLSLVARLGSNSAPRNPSRQGAYHLCPYSDGGESCRKDRQGEDQSTCCGVDCEWRSVHWLHLREGRSYFQGCLLRFSLHRARVHRNETVVGQTRKSDSGSLSVQLQFMMSLTINTTLELSTAKPWLVSLAKESDCTMSLTLITAMELSAVKPWLVKPESSNSAAKHDVSNAFPFTALELSALKPCWVMPTGESDCKVTDCVSHVKRPQTHMMLSSSSTHIHMRTHVKIPNKYGKNAISN